MALFTCPDSATALADEAPTLPTPLGHLLFDVAVGGARLSGRPPDSARRLARGGRLLAWQSAGFAAELLLCRLLAPPPPDGVADRWAGLWRLRAGAAMVPPPTFICEWQPGFRWRVDDGADPDECLAARTWHDGRTELTLGTSDAEGLGDAAAHGEDGEWLPARWAPVLYFGGVHGEEYTAFGLRVSLPALRAGEGCQVAFVVAWGPYAPDDIATWRAVAWARLGPWPILDGEGRA